MTPAEREAAFKWLTACIDDNADLALALDEERAARSRIQAELDQACADRDMARAQKERVEGELLKMTEDRDWHDRERLLEGKAKLRAEHCLRAQEQVTKTLSETIVRMQGNVPT